MNVLYISISQYLLCILEHLSGSFKSSGFHCTMLLISLLITAGKRPSYSIFELIRLVYATIANNTRSLAGAVIQT